MDEREARIDVDLHLMVQVAWKSAAERRLVLHTFVVFDAGEDNAKDFVSLRGQQIHGSVCVHSVGVYP